MIISQEQVQRAVEYLRTPSTGAPAARGDISPETVPPELLARVHAALDGCPDVRQDRVDHARCMVAGDCPSSDEVAEKLIGRIVSDSLR